jgi:pyruvate/2-oxoglutarate dehydrogenase complex dihydrolipoamide dehydrogenase (E3) component
VTDSSGYDIVILGGGSGGYAQRCARPSLASAWP